jgi:hypothetical protein
MDKENMKTVTWIKEKVVVAANKIKRTPACSLLQRGMVTRNSALPTKGITPFGINRNWLQFLVRCHATGRDPS